MPPSWPNAIPSRSRGPSSIPVRLPGRPGSDPAAIEALRGPVAEALRRAFGSSSRRHRRDHARRGGGRAAAPGRAELIEACDGFLRREAIAASLTAEERRRDPARDGADARAVDNRLKAFFTGSEVRYGGVGLPGQGLPLARPGGDLRRRASGCGAAPRYRDADGGMARRRRRAADPRPRRRAGDAAGRRDGAHGPERADGQGRPADGRQGPPHRRLRLGHPARRRAARRSAPLDDRRHGDGVRARGTRPRRRCRSSARAARRSANGTRRSTCAPRAGCRRSSASRTTRPRSRRRSPISPPCACSPTRPPATASRASRSTAPIPRRSPRPSPGRPSARARAQGPTLIELVRHAHVRPRAPRRHAVPRQGSAAVVGLPRRSPSRATPTASSTSSGRRAIRSPTYAAQLLEARASIAHGDLERLQARGRGAGRRARRGAVIDAPWPEPAHAGRRRVRGRSRRACASRCSSPRPRCDARRRRAARRSSPARRSTRRARRSSRR